MSSFLLKTFQCLPLKISKFFQVVDVRALFDREAVHILRGKVSSVLLPLASCELEKKKRERWERKHCLASRCTVFP